MWAFSVRNQRGFLRFSDACSFDVLPTVLIFIAGSILVPSSVVIADDKPSGGSETRSDPPTLAGNPSVLKSDDGVAAGRKSFPRGIAAAFESVGDGEWMTEVQLHASRYGYPEPPEEDFVITLCDSDFKPIKSFRFPYRSIERGEADWVKLKVDPTPVPKRFVLCLNFNPTRTKGVFISHDAEGKGLVGLPGRRAGSFSGGDWMVRVKVDQAE